MPDDIRSASPPDLDAATVDAIVTYLGLTPERMERLQLLREQVTLTLNEEFAVVASDLNQLRSILSDAAAKLSGTFRVVTAGSDELRSTIAHVQSDHDLPSLRRIREIADDMASTSGATVQSLQFEDMATQLLQHVDRKLTVLGNLAQEMAVINPTSARVPPILGGEQLDLLFERLEYYRTELSVGARKVVQQQSLESGDIELF